MRCLTVVAVVLVSSLIAAEAVSIKKQKSEQPVDKQKGKKKLIHRDIKPKFGFSEDVKVKVDEESIKKPIELLKPENEESKKEENVKTEEEKVSYQNTKVIRITLKNKQEAAFIKALETDGGKQIINSEMLLSNVFPDDKSVYLTRQLHESERHCPFLLARTQNLFTRESNLIHY